MNFFKITLTSLALFSLLTVSNANAKEYPSDLTFENAISETILALESSTYKDISVVTTAGSLVGEFVKKTKEVLILKQYTGSIHSKTGKEKVHLTFIKLDSITAISISILE